MASTFFTIGHSTRSLDEFVNLLRENRIAAIADIRRIPRSRTNPQFNTDTFGIALAERQIAYSHIAELGGLRSRKKSAEPSPNTYWTNDSFRNFADYTATEAFAQGLHRLEALGESHRTAIMCAEVVWWRCHRRIVADYLICGGHPVVHIMGPAKSEPAKLTPAARREGDRLLVYPAG
jgi:uncharacterized protein (DUF488 family)